MDLGADGERLQRCGVCSVCMLGMFHAQALWGSTLVGKGTVCLVMPGSWISRCSLVSLEGK